MITSINEIRRRTKRFRKQRLTLTIRKSRLFRDASDTDVSSINGIFMFATRPRGKDLSKIRLHLADTVVDGEPFPLRRRTSRHKKRYFNSISISLTDIVWSAQPSTSSGVDGDSKELPEPIKEGEKARHSSQPDGIEKGKAGFLARLLPAPGTPPDDQIGAPLPSGSGQRDTYRIEPSNFQQVFNSVRRKIRANRRREDAFGCFEIRDEERRFYERVIALLKQGITFRNVVSTFCES
jgi:hypothetical protein